MNTDLMCEYDRRNLLPLPRSIREPCLKLFKSCLNVDTCDEDQKKRDYIRSISKKIW
jgi:hypothetical protein